MAKVKILNLLQLHYQKKIKTKECFIMMKKLMLLKSKAKKKTPNQINQLMLKLLKLKLMMSLRKTSYNYRKT